MSKFEILCVTMNQNDFAKVKEMNIKSNVVFANQSDHTSYEEMDFEGHKAKMISTETRGVGINRNLALMYASADICLFADDDVKYVDNVEEIVTKEFDAHPDADVIIFNLDTDTDDDNKRPRKYHKTRKHRKFESMPWGGCRIAVRLNSIKKANVMFTTLFGGGCVFPSGEDSMWLKDAKKKGLVFYVSKETVGTVYFESSSWFTGYNERFYYGKGAFYQAVHPKTHFIWRLYCCWRMKNHKELSFKQKMNWMKHGKQGYRETLSFQSYISKNNIEIQ